MTFDSKSERFTVCFEENYPFRWVNWMSTIEIVWVLPRFWRAVCGQNTFLEVSPKKQRKFNVRYNFWLKKWAFHCVFWNKLSISLNKLEVNYQNCMQKHRFLEVSPKKRRKNIDFYTIYEIRLCIFTAIWKIDVNNIK